MILAKTGRHIKYWDNIKYWENGNSHLGDRHVTWCSHFNVKCTGFGQVCRYPEIMLFTASVRHTERHVHKHFYSKVLETTFGNQTRELISKFNLVRIEGKIKIHSKAEHKRLLESSEAVLE